MEPVSAKVTSPPPEQLISAVFSQSESPRLTATRHRDERPTQAVLSGLVASATASGKVLGRAVFVGERW